MDSQKALDFLSRHQPLPADSELGNDIKTFDEIRKYFKENYDERCIPLLLSSFGKGDGYGVYQQIENTISVYPPDLVIPCIIKNIQSRCHGIRYWNIEIAQNFPTNDYVNLLRDLREYEFDTRYQAVLLLIVINSPSSKALLEELLGHEPDDEIRALILGHLGAAEIK